MALIEVSVAGELKPPKIVAQNGFAISRALSASGLLVCAAHFSKTKLASAKFSASFRLIANGMRTMQFQIDNSRLNLERHNHAGGGTMFCDGKCLVRHASLLQRNVGQENSINAEQNDKCEA